MKKIIKIAMAISMLFLITGIASAAFDVDSLKPIPDYNNFQNGCSTCTYGNQYFFVEKSYDDYKQYFFENNTDYDFSVSYVGDKIYYFEDDLFELYGYEEVVEFDGEPYLISINQDSKLSPEEQTQYLNALKEFNKLNNLEPIAV